MQEALTLFDSICNSRWFVKTSIILFLNKIDIFKGKLQREPLSESFPDFTGKCPVLCSYTNSPFMRVGPETYDDASDYILNRFVSLNQSDSKQIYTHFTCATDTLQIKFVMAAVNDIIIQNNLKDVGLL
jgi:guanine nucleotide-binding protein subunit alpha